MREAMKLPPPSRSVLQKLSTSMCLLVSLFLVLVKCRGASSESTNLIGLGSYDITGPAADVNMMGYANIEQTTSGIHFRLRARTFIVAEPQGNSVVFVNLDVCMASQLVTIKVIERLKARLILLMNFNLAVLSALHSMSVANHLKYGDLYTEDNVAISGIHTHAGPGGYLQYVVYIITSLGFVQQSFNALVDGIEKSITQAHENLRPGSIFINKGILNQLELLLIVKFAGELLDASINRSPSAYLNNPEEERRNYKYDTDKEMTLMKFVDEEWGPIGSFNWFATHGTSMSRTNSLISGDNKGAAARFMEDWYNTDVMHKGFESQSLIKSGAYKVPRRISNIIPDFHEHRVPLGRLNALNSYLHFVNQIVAIYPDEFESTRIIGERQFEKAMELFQNASEQLKGTVRYRHTYIDFSDLPVQLSEVGESNELVRTCPAAMGFSFAAGTTDGPGAFDFKQGDDEGNAFWKLVGGLLKKPDEKQINCQDPKPILIDTGEMHEPYDWAPSILPIQILQIGQLVILSVPGEFTTMAGRRLRDAVKEVLTSGDKEESDNNVHVVIAGLTNTYSQYVTTFEEYQIQRYEGASTLYGPHTLNAYIQEFNKLASSLISDKPVERGPQPPDLLDDQISLLTPVVMDSTPLSASFGDCKTDIPLDSIFKRGDIVKAMFWSACPRNDLMTEGTFALVEILQSGNNWEPAYDDDDWCLKFKWSRPSKLSARSYATIEWHIPDAAVSGVYRITHFGASKSLFGSVKHFTGSSTAFTVV
ncbi:Neutral/alkaline nonlysosomal ceramidase [Cynara cardunculus var. scolymus]|uniref:Neutral ceramidase n=1 Tax=Cynara cardunculus var. scolymus TaxID=59895 RepID=A0A118JW19_CYNCS|nr:Neutral/alkaline nonlysosomal ceramidase [Cynara cardunculus var. scolymus]